MSAFQEGSVASLARKVGSTRVRVKSIIHAILQDLGHALVVFVLGGEYIYIPYHIIRKSSGWGKVSIDR